MKSGRIRFKACAKCKGDLYHNEDNDWACFQCGKIEYVRRDNYVPPPRAGNRFRNG